MGQLFKQYIGGAPALFIDFGSRYIWVLDDSIKEYINDNKKKLVDKLIEILEKYKKKFKYQLLSCCLFS